MIMRYTALSLIAPILICGTISCAAPVRSTPAGPAPTSPAQTAPTTPSADITARPNPAAQGGELVCFSASEAEEIRAALTTGGKCQAREYVTLYAAPIVVEPVDRRRSIMAAVILSGGSFLLGVIAGGLAVVLAQ